MTQFYAYIHCKPDGSPFYVGKGKGGRAYEFKRPRNPYYANTVAKYGTPLVGKLDCSSEEIAFELEKGLIKCLRRMGVKLTNLTDGGDGTSGYRHDDAAKEKCRIAASGPNNSWYGKKRPEHSEALKGRKRPFVAAQMRAWIAKHGHPNGMLGKKHSEETLELMRKRAEERKMAEKSSAMFKGIPKSDEQKAKMAQSATGHVWLNKAGKKTHCKEEKALELEKLGWKRGQK